MYKLLNKHSEIENALGENNYATKLRYMTKKGLEELLKMLEARIANNTFDYFDCSLLGRSYARLYIVNEHQDNSLLAKAETYVTKALVLAIKSKDLIEIAVQNWYLSLIYIDKNDFHKANKHLSETKRLDENIMGRKPGIAWLRVSEYRLSLHSNDKNQIKRSRKKAYNCMQRLGMKNIDEYLEREYYF